MDLLAGKVKVDTRVAEVRVLEATTADVVQGRGASIDDCRSCHVS